MGVAPWNVKLNSCKNILAFENVLCKFSAILDWTKDKLDNENKENKIEEVQKMALKLWQMTNSYFFLIEASNEFHSWSSYHIFEIFH